MWLSHSFPIALPSSTAVATPLHPVLVMESNGRVGGYFCLFLVVAALAHSEERKDASFVGIVLPWRGFDGVASVARRLGLPRHRPARNGNRRGVARPCRSWRGPNRRAGAIRRSEAGKAKECFYFRLTSSPVPGAGGCYRCHSN